MSATTGWSLLARAGRDEADAQPAWRPDERAWRRRRARGMTSFNLAAILAVTFSAAVWQPDLRGSAHSQESARPLAAAPAAVTIIDAAPRGRECGEQTWPYIERRCLSYAPPQAKSAAQPGR